METFIIKRDGKKEAFSIEKIKSAIRKAFLSVGTYATEEVIANILCRVNITQDVTVEEIQNQVEIALMSNGIMQWQNRICFIARSIWKTERFAINWSF